jgi:RES domain-containing protein
MNLANCATLVRGPISGTWYRAVQMRFLSTVLSTAHTPNIPSRFNPAYLHSTSFEVLYLAENRIVALFEVQAIFGGLPGTLVPNPATPWVIANVRVSLNSIVDLGDAALQMHINTNAQELTGDWQGYQDRGPTTSVNGPTGLAPTQELGLALYQTPDVEGFQVLSARVPTSRTLVVFPGKLRVGSEISFLSTVTGELVTIRGEAARRGRRKGR